MKLPRLFVLLLFLNYGGSLSAQQQWKDTLVNGLHGIADSTGKLVLLPLYDEVNASSYNALDWTTGNVLSSGETVFTARRNGKWGLFDEKGKALLPVIYDDVVIDYGEKGSYRIIAAKKKKYYAFFDPDGHAITGFAFTEIDTGDFGNGVIAYVKRKGSRKFELLNKNGKLVSGSSSNE